MSFHAGGESRRSFVISHFCLPCGNEDFERRTYKNLILNKHALWFNFFVRVFTGTECRGLSLKRLSRKACVRRWWNGKLVFKFQHLARTTISKKWKPLKVFSWFFFILQTSKTIINFKITTMKKETWKLVIQLIVSVLTAVATTLGVTSCMWLRTPKAC